MGMGAEDYYVVRTPVDGWHTVIRWCTGCGNEMEAGQMPCWFDKGYDWCNRCEGLAK